MGVTDCIGSCAQEMPPRKRKVQGKESGGRPPKRKEPELEEHGKSNEKPPLLQQPTRHSTSRQQLSPSPQVSAALGPRAQHG